jgi:hypothetical protein
LAVIGVMLLLFTRDIDDVDVVITASTTSTSTTPSTSTTSTSTSTSTTSSTSTSTTSTTVPVATDPAPPDLPPPPVTVTPTAETTTTTSAVPPPDPEIVRFSVRDLIGVTVVCRSGFGREAVWLTRDADEVSLVTPLQTFEGLDPSGSQIFCAGPLEIVTLTASGPGGTATATTQTPDNLI